VLLDGSATGGLDEEARTELRRSGSASPLPRPFCSAHSASSRMCHALFKVSQSILRRRAAPSDAGVRRLPAAIEAQIDELAVPDTTAWPSRAAWSMSLRRSWWKISTACLPG